MLAVAEYLYDLCACEECVHAEAKHIADNGNCRRLKALANGEFVLTYWFGRCFIAITTGRPGLGPS